MKYQIIIIEISIMIIGILIMIIEISIMIIGILIMIIEISIMIIEISNNDNWNIK